MTNPIIPLVVIIPLLTICLVGYSAAVIIKKIGIAGKILRILRVAVIIALVFMINLRIMTKKYNVDVELKNIDVLFVVDTTISMWAEDHIGVDNRMAAVQKDCQYIMDSLAGSNFSLIRFDNRSQILAPFTQDSKNVADAFATIKTPDKYYAKGTNLNAAHDDTMDMLKSSNNKEGRITIIFFISDGEVTSDKEEQVSYADLADLIDGGAVLGYGTPEGGRMFDKNSNSYIRDPETGSDALSKYDEENLKRLASEMHVDYIHMDESMRIEYLLDSIKSGSVMKLANSDNVSYEDTYFYYVPLLTLLLAIEMIFIIRRGRI